jgi:uridine kinase
LVDKLAFSPTPYYIRPIKPADPRKEPATLLIAIVGGSGSGKTWLADRIFKTFPGRSTRLALDDFYRDRSHLSPAARARCNFDNPNAIDWQMFEKALGSLALGQDAVIPCYDFTTHCRKQVSKIVHVKPLVIADGLWLLRRPAIRKLFHFTIFLECPTSTRLRRRLERDTQTRGRTPASIRRQFHDTVNPMHERFVEPQKRFADLVLGGNIPPSTVREILDRIRAMMDRFQLST